MAVFRLTHCQNCHYFFRQLKNTVYEKRNNGSVIFMTFVAPQAYVARVQPTFEAILKRAQFE